MNALRVERVSQPAAEVTVADQLRLRMEELKVDTHELARRVGVSNQTVRYWVEGRNYPRRAVVGKVEEALSFKLDFTGGLVTSPDTVTEHLHRMDVDTLVQLRRMPAPVRQLVHDLVAAMNEHFERKTELVREDERRILAKQLESSLIPQLREQILRPRAH